MDHSLLKQIILDQQAEEPFADEYIKRKIEEEIPSLMKNKEIIVITGVRRCGKSIILQQIRQMTTESDYYFNFEDDRLITFSIEDFQSLLEVFIELFGNQKTFFFDEIQNIEGWELFVRRLYNQGNKIYITGSNATLFSEELGTRLTGRYIDLKMHPYSFREYIYHANPKLSEKSIFTTKEIGEVRKRFEEYLKLGGFPEYVKFQHKDYLHTLYESIIYRDILARYNIPRNQPILEMVYYLASNIGKPTTYSALKRLIKLGSVSTASDYCYYLESSFLCFFVSCYSDSLKQQMSFEKKVYFIDHALSNTVGFRFSKDSGRLLENLVFVELKRRNYEIYYHKLKKECDFIIRRDSKVCQAIQVCDRLENEITKEREYCGLLEALETHSLKEGYILTRNAEFSDTVQKGDFLYQIHVLPVWKWLLI